jgi:hypothetical protein
MRDISDLDALVRALIDLAAGMLLAALAVIAADLIVGLP